jgi:hypothetical protein
MVNNFIVVKQYRDYDGGMRLVGEVVQLDPARAATLRFNGLIQSAPEPVITVPVKPVVETAEAKQPKFENRKRR